MNLKGIDHWPFVIPHNPAAEEIDRRNALNLEAWCKKYNRIPRKWVMWEGEDYSKPSILRKIGAL